ncbi:hypothetical protein, partial [Haloarcula sp. H-GB5]
RTTGTVEVVAGAEEAREVGVVEAVEAMDGAVDELYELGEARGETVSELAQEVEGREETVEELRDGVRELAGYFAELVEAAGGEVEFENVEKTGPTVPEALENVDMEEFEA